LAGAASKPARSGRDQAARGLDPGERKMQRTDQMLEAFAAFIAIGGSILLCVIAVWIG